jgi:hypothetical protein
MVAELEHTLPSLARLGFYDHLIKNAVAKQEGCTEYLAPWDETTTNCSIQGYLMAKRVVPPSRPQFLPSQYLSLDRHTALGVPLTVSVGETDFVLVPFPRVMSIDDRLKQLVERNINVRMSPECIINKKPRRSITWTGFKHDIIQQTDWYLNIPRGLLFLRYCNDGAKGARLHNLPFGTHLQHPYLFVILVCNGAVDGLGSTLMDIAEQAAQQLGVKDIVLAALPGVTGYYYNRHDYHFIDREGKTVDVTPWIVNQKLPLETTDGPFAEPLRKPRVVETFRDVLEDKRYSLLPPEETPLPLPSSVLHV